MIVPFLQVDAFTGRPFAGNPAAVCLLEEPAGERWMQAVAAEMNLSETAFAWPAAEGRHGLRWFTPTVEVQLCGHATLATAHVLWSEGVADPADELRFDTASGELRAGRQDDLVVIDLPADPPGAHEPDTSVLGPLGVLPTRVARGRQNWLVEVATAAEVRACRPDFAALAAVDAVVVVTAPADPGTDAAVVSRCFGPAYGIDEDPVTGSAHCLLGPWWAPRLGTDTFVAHQLSSRGGEVRVTVSGDRVQLGGRAVTVLRGELLAGPDA